MTMNIDLRSRVALFFRDAKVVVPAKVGIMALLLVASVLAGCRRSSPIGTVSLGGYGKADYACGAVGNKAGVVMHGVRLTAAVDGLDVAKGWLDAVAVLLDDRTGTSLNDQISTIRDHTDGRYGLYCLARAQHWWGYGSARHESTKYLAGDKKNWDFKTDDTYPANWTHDFMVGHPHSGTSGPVYIGMRKLYMRYKAWENWSK